MSEKFKNHHYLIIFMAFLLFVLVLGFVLKMPDYAVLDNGVTKNIEQTINNSVNISDASFEDFDGKMLSVADFSEDYIVLNFWASWCSPCIEELPSLMSLQNNADFKGTWRVLAVSIDLPRNYEESIRIINELNIQNIAWYVDPNSSLQTALKVRGIPVTAILGPDRKVLDVVKGSRQWDSIEMMAFLKKMKADH